MICVIGVVARVSPGHMHLARCQVGHQRGDGLLPIKRVGHVHSVIADGVREIHVVSLNGL